MAIILVGGLEVQDRCNAAVITNTKVRFQFSQGLGRRALLTDFEPIYKSDMYSDMDDLSA